MNNESLSSDCTFDDFLKIDIRVGTITDAIKIEKSDKLLVLTVWFGDKIGARQIVAGIRKNYTPEDLISQNAAFIVNLPPRSLMGHNSHGMILAAANSEGLPCVLLFPHNTPAGTRVG